jgi:hypothetical protein
MLTSKILKEIGKELDRQIKSETTESLNEWLFQKINEMNNVEKFKEIINKLQQINKDFSLFDTSLTDIQYWFRNTHKIEISIDCCDYTNNKYNIKLQYRYSPFVFSLLDNKGLNNILDYYIDMSWIERFNNYTFEIYDDALLLGIEQAIQLYYENKEKEIKK